MHPLKYIHQWQFHCGARVCQSFVDIPAPKIQQLLEELKPVDKWYLFGVKLNVPVYELNKIKSSEAQGAIELYKTHTLQYWLNSNPTASWKDVVRALEQIDHLRLASQVKRKYLLPQNADSELNGI